MANIQNKSFQPELKSLFKKAPNRLIFSQQSPRHSSLVINQFCPDITSIGIINKSSFIYQHPIGRGGFGKVWKVELKRTKTPYALKEMQKLRIVSKRSIYSVMNELKLLKILRNPFIVNMHFAFQDRENLYLILDLKNAGDLRFQLTKAKRFKESHLKFFTCCILLGLRYLHSNQIIHRDIKPENLVFDERGYLFITDFGIARAYQTDHSKETSGTPAYMAPEVLFRKPYNTTIDYYALGVILFELITNKRPYSGRERKELRASILVKQAKISDPPEGFSFEAVDFVNKLITRKPENRLGSKGFDEIVKHPWIKGENWSGIEKQELTPPFAPFIEDQFDPNRVTEFKDELDHSINLSAIQGLFSGYNHDSRIAECRFSNHRKSLTAF